MADERSGYRPEVFVQEFLGTKLTYRFNAYKILDQDEAELRANPNPFAVVVLTALLALKHKKASDMLLKDIKHNLFREMLKRKIPTEIRQAIFDFLNRYVNFENTEILNIFEKEIEESLQLNETMGTREYLLEKAKTEGRMEERARSLKDLKAERTKAREEKRSIALAFKKLGISVENIAQSTGLSVKEVAQLG